MIDSWLRFKKLRPNIRPFATQIKAKIVQNLGDFGQLQTLIANISETDGDIQNRTT